MERFESSPSAHTHFPRLPKAPLRSESQGGGFFDELRDWDIDTVPDSIETEAVTFDSRESLLRLLADSKTEKKTKQSVKASEPADHLPGWVHDFDAHPMPSQSVPERLKRKQELGLLGDLRQKQNVAGRMSNHT